MAPAGPSLLSANPTVIDFQATQSNLSQFSDELLIQLSDAAGGSTYTAIPNQGWLSVRPASGVLPAVLRVAVNAQGLQPGTYTGAIAVTTSSGAQLPLSVTFRVTTADPSSFKVLSPSIQLVATGTAADEGRTALFGVKNTGAQTMRFQFGKKNSSAAWFKVTPDSADISVDQAIEVKVQLQAGGLPGGVTASETVTVTAGGVTREIPVVVTVASATGGTPLWSLSEGGTTMFNSKGAWSEETQTIYLANAGPGTLDWAATEELGLVTVTPAFKDVMPAGGVQDLTLRTTSAVEKSLEKQSVLVFRRTGTADAKTFIVYIEQVDGVLPPRPNVAGVILNLGPQSRSKVKLRYTASGSQEVTFPNKPAWLDIVYPGSPGPAWMRDKKGIEMEFAINDLSKVQIGQHFTLTLNFPGMPKINGKEHLINIEIVIGGVLTRAACAPVELQAVFLNPPSLSDLKARLPTPVEAEIVDNCGEPLRSGAASVIFSSEDPSIALSLWPDGIWRGTWQPVDVSKPQVTLKLSAISNQNLRPAHAFAAVSVLPNAQQPVIQQGGVRNAANITRPNADSLAPGSMISLAGEQLAPREETYSGVPSTTLAGVRVSIGGRYATLLYASPKRINAVVPFDSPLGPTQLIVEREGAFSVPLPVVVVGAQPGIFTEDQSGAGQGSVLTEDGVLAGPQNPARRGRIIQIYCTGLGPVEPNPPSGQAAPSSPPARVTASRVALVGGNSAEIVFAGLVPGYWGLYQVNVRVPEDVTPGSAVPVRLLIDGFESNTVTIGVQ